MLRRQFEAMSKQIDMDTLQKLTFNQRWKPAQVLSGNLEHLEWHYSPPKWISPSENTSLYAWNFLNQVLQFGAGYQVIQLTQICSCHLKRQLDFANVYREIGDKSLNNLMYV
jgi:hypothetical protein